MMYRKLQQNAKKNLSKYEIGEIYQNIYDYQTEILTQNDNSNYNPKIINEKTQTVEYGITKINDNISYVTPTGSGSVKLTLSLTDNNSSNFTNNEVSFTIRDLHSTVTTIDNSIKMITYPFTLPRIQYSSGTTGDYYYNREVYVKIDEIPSQYNFNVGNGKFNYTFKCGVADLNSVAIQLLPTASQVVFTNPINNIESLTLSFYRKNGFGNYVRIPLLRPYLQVRAIAGTNPARFSVINSDTVFHIHGHIDAEYPNFTADVKQAVAFMNFSSPDVTLNTFMVREKGFVVNELYPSSTEFTIDEIDLTTLASDTDCTMYIFKNNQDIELEFITSIYNNNNLTTIT